MSVAGSGQPWWATDDGDGRAAPDPDPLVRHRRARWGLPDDPGDEATASGTDGPAPEGSDDEAGAADVHGHWCGVCPICAGLRRIEELRPDLAVHLAEAARHLTQAVRVLLDGALAATPGPATAPGPVAPPPDAGGTTGRPARRGPDDVPAGLTRIEVEVADVDGPRSTTGPAAARRKPTGRDHP